MAERVSLPRTVTVNEQSVVNPAPSVALYMTWLVPMSKRDPGTSTVRRETVGAMLLSVATGTSHETLAVACPASVATTTLFGQLVKVGGMVSAQGE